MLLLQSLSVVRKAQGRKEAGGEAVRLAMAFRVCDDVILMRLLALKF